MQDIFIGVDGGGTKSKARVENSAGELIGQGIGGPSNIRLSVNKAWESIYQALTEALSVAELQLTDKDYQFHIGLGLAGSEVHEAVTAFLAYPHSFKTIQLISDAHAACLGAHRGRDGSIIIAGTGVVGYQIQSGKGYRVGGWGFPHDDEGSGAWIGLQAASLTFQWLDHRVEKSLLAEEVFAFFNHDIEHFTTWANRANSSEFARLAPLVINHSQQEEIFAVKIMKKAAHALDRVALALHKTQIHKEPLLPCCLFGGVAPFLEPWLGDELRQTLVSKEADATVGAILALRETIKSC